jgi:hypothetical protein
MRNLDDLLRENLRLQEEMSRNGVEFLFTELELSLTFASIAAAGMDEPERRARNTANSRKGYDILLMIGDRIRMDKEDEERLKSGLKRLKARLVELGEEF